MSQDSPATTDSWNELAKATHGFSHKSPTPSTTLMLSRMNNLWPFSQAKGIFDNGCGTGSFMTRILDAHGEEIPTSAKLLGGDFSEGMLDGFRQKIQERLKTQTPTENGANGEKESEVWNRLELRHIDAHDLSSIPSDSFSHITGNHVYFLLSDPRKALKETHRVLVPNGVLAVSNGKRSDHIDALNAAVEDVRPGTNLSILSGTWTSEAGVKGELEATGFTDVETHLVDSRTEYETHEGWAKMLLKMPVLKDASNGYSEEEKRQLEANLVRRLKKACPDEPGVLTGTSIVTVARKSA